MRRRLDMLATLARLQDEELSSRAGVLSGLQSEVGLLEAEQDLLDQSRVDGGGVTSIEAMPYRGAFMRTMRKENARLATARADLDQKIDAQREHVLEAYRELRSSEHLKVSLQDQITKHAMEAEQKILDESGMLNFMRKKV